MTTLKSVLKTKKQSLYFCNSHSSNICIYMFMYPKMTFDLHKSEKKVTNIDDGQFVTILCVCHELGTTHT